MLSADIPVACDGAAQTGGDESGRGTERVHRDRGDPEDGSRRPTRQTTGEPEQSGCRLPGEDSLKVAMEPRVVARPDDGERGPADLHRHKRAREQEPPLAERVGQGDGHDQGGHHGADQHHPHRSPVRIEPVGQPGRVDPGPPQRQQQQRRLRGAAQIQTLAEQMGQLGDREDIDEVEKELHRGDLMVALTLAAQQSSNADATRSWSRHHCRSVVLATRFRIYHPIMPRLRNRRDSEVRL